MNLLITGAFSCGDEYLKKIELLGYNITFVPNEQLILTIDVSKIEVVICNSLFMYNDIKKFENLKFIQLVSSGLDRVPLDYINENDIKISNAKDVYSIPMAEWVILKILELYKKSKIFYKNQENKIWNKERNLFELTEKKVLIIGYGSVGFEVAKRLKAFGTNIAVSDIVIKNSIDDPYIDEFYKIIEIDRAIEKSDIIILTLPLTKETRHLIDEKKMSLMKKNSILINISRGEIVEEKALIKFLKTSKIEGVALDVFEEEPLKYENELWTLDKVIITPHNSFVSDLTISRLRTVVIKNLLEFKGGVLDGNIFKNKSE